MKQHLTYIKNYDGNYVDLAGEIADLRYDALHEFLIELSVQLRTAAEKDQERGRLVLAKHLVQSSLDILRAAVSIKLAWGVCEKHMEEIQ